MSDDQVLFDLPTPKPQPSPARSGRGRARERYARNVTADVTVQQMSVLLDAAVRAFDGSLTIDIGEAGVDDEMPDAQERMGRDPAAALSWLLDPELSHSLGIWLPIWI